MREGGERETCQLLDCNWGLYNDLVSFTWCSELENWYNCHPQGIFAGCSFLKWFVYTHLPCFVIYAWFSGNNLLAKAETKSTQLFLGNYNGAM